MPGHRAQDWIVGSAGKSDAEFLAAQAYFGLAFDKEPVFMEAVPWRALFAEWSIFARREPRSIGLKKPQS